MQKRYLFFLVDPSFLGVNRLFDLSCKNEQNRESLKKYYLPTADIKDYNFMVDGKTYFDKTK